MYGICDLDVMYDRTDVCQNLPLLWSIVRDPQLIG